MVLLLRKGERKRKKVVPAFKVIHNKQGSNSNSITRDNPKYLTTQIFMKAAIIKHHESSFAYLKDTLCHLHLHHSNIKSWDASALGTRVKKKDKDKSSYNAKVKCVTSDVILKMSHKNSNK